VFVSGHLWEPGAGSGGVMSHGADRNESFQPAAALVDRIFKGANPAELPFERPRRYLLVINVDGHWDRLEIPQYRSPTR